MKGSNMKLSTLAVLALVLATSVAAAAPSTMTFAGRLSTTAGPVNGQVTVQFRLFANGSGGTAVWGPESHTLMADNGLVYANLGTLSTLDQSVFNGQVMYLEIQVGAEVLSPRLTINAVPYALQSESAELLGTIAPDDVVTGVTGGTNITAVKTGNNVSVGLVTAGCTAGQVYKWNGASFACAADSDTTYTGGTGIAVASGTISLSTTGCVAGEVWKYNGTTFSCEPDIDTNTSYTAGSGIAIASGSISLSTTGCVAGEVWKFNGTAFSCDPDASTTYTGGTGVSIAGTTVSLSTTGCVAGESWVFNGTTFDCVAAYSNADAVAAITAQTRTRTRTYGPTHFSVFVDPGDTISCTLPGTNCVAPAGTTTVVRVPLDIVSGATLTNVGCLVLDNDATSNITITAFSGNTNIGSAVTSGASTGSQTIAITTFASQPLSTSARGPVLQVSMVSTAAQPQMFLYQCTATYTEPAL